MGPPAAVAPRPATPVVLTVAGSDSGGGAGIQADLACFLALGVYGTSAVTAVTSQNSRGISGVQEMPPAFVAEQIRQVCDDLDVVSAKTGMLASAPTIEAVAVALRACGLPRLVTDPVLVATGGTRLLARDAETTLITELFPLALIVTPNLPEAEALLGAGVRDVAEMREAARRLHDLGPAWVLVKGGHLEGRPVDILYDGTSFQEFGGDRVGGPPVHGTGCVLSAAIVAHLARGASVPEAIERAKDHVTGAIRHARIVGSGAVADPAWNLQSSGDGGEDR